jgi:anti-sigma-K factor RskA
VTPEEIEALLGAYALDAVDDDERAEIEEYLAVNPRARAEVDTHREVATLMAFSGATAPEGLWDRISGAMDERAPEPGPELAKVLPVRRRRWPTGAVAGAAVAAAAAAALITVVAVREPASHRTDLGSMAQVFDRALADPDSKRVVLESSDGAQRAVAVVEPGGLGLISLRDVTDLGLDRTYQLWGVIDGEVISLGVLGHRPEVEPFTVDGDLSALVVTDEVAGGVPSSQQPPLLSGQVT